MFTVFLQGAALGAAMIIPIGAQNAFVIAQGIKRQHHLMIASFCALSDLALIAFGVFGGGALLSSSFILLQCITWAGVLFLLYYGWGALKQAWFYQRVSFTPQNVTMSRKKILLMLFAVTWLNPHVYLDTVVIIGSAASQWSDALRPYFALGAMTASVIWFYSIALLAAKLGPVLEKPTTQKMIHLAITIIMWTIALQLAKSAISML